MKLEEIASRTGARVGYEYDYGDAWDHLITLECLNLFVTPHLSLDLGTVTEAGQELLLEVQRKQHRRSE